jgi:uracil-DNA glycosylase
VPPATDEAVAALAALDAEVGACTLCDLHATRTRAVPGEGDPGADLMFVGEAPGYHEDQQGRPFVGQAGRLLEQLLSSIGLTREQVFIANVLKSRPPNNRDPRPDEIAACQPYLWRQIEIIKPKVICTLGNFATKLLSGSPAGITRVHGQPQPTVISGHSLYLFPIFHPAAALYTPAMLTTLKEDFLRLPELLAHAAPQAGEAAAPPAAERPAWRPAERPAVAAEPPAQPDLLTASEPVASEPAAQDETASTPDETAPAPHEPVAVDPAADEPVAIDPAPHEPVVSAAPAPDPEPATPARPEQLGLF